MNNLGLAMIAAGYIFGGFLWTGIYARKWSHAFEIAFMEAGLAVIMIWNVS